MVIEGVKRIGIERIPLLASPQGGVAERLIKCREAPADREAGVVFRLRTQRKTTPAASASVASQHFLDDAATPCGDARRGIRSSVIRSHPHRPPLQYQVLPFVKARQRGSEQTSTASVWRHLLSLSRLPCLDLIRSHRMNAQFVRTVFVIWLGWYLAG